jgi:hypothetical protein
VSHYEAPLSDERMGLNSLVQLLLSFASSVFLRPKSCRTLDHNLLSDMSPNVEVQVSIFPQEQSHPVTTLGIGFPLITSCSMQCYNGGILTHLHTGITGIWDLETKSKLSYDRRSVSQSILVSAHNLEPATNYSFSSMEFI